MFNQLVHSVSGGVGNAIIVFQFDNKSISIKKRHLIFGCCVVIISFVYYFTYDYLKEIRIENRLRDSIQDINQVDLHKIKIDILTNLNTISKGENIDNIIIINKKAYKNVMPLLVDMDANIIVNNALIKDSNISLKSIEKLVEINKVLQTDRADIENLIQDLIKQYKIKNNINI